MSVECEKLALRPKDAAAALGISARHLWQLTHDGVIPAVRLGDGRRRTTLYPVAMLTDWLTAQAASSTAGGTHHE